MTHQPKAPLPDFFVIGAPKCGTTSLWHALRAHPDVFMPDEKESRFFKDRFESKSMGWYRALFEPGRDAQAVGEATPGYSHVFLFPEIPARMARHVPAARLIYMVRHPLRRMESAWKQNVFMGRLPPDTFDDAVRKYLPIVEGSRYFRNLNAFREHFPDERIQVVFLDDFAERPDDVLARCFDFLGVDAAAPAFGAHENAADDHSLVPNAYYTIQEMAGLRALKDILPQSVKRLASKAVLNYMKEPLPEPEWNAPTKAWATNCVKKDARRLLEYAGKPADFWNFKR